MHGLIPLRAPLAHSQGDRKVPLGLCLTSSRTPCFRTPLKGLRRAIKNVPQARITDVLRAWVRELALTRLSFYRGDSAVRPSVTGPVLLGPWGAHLRSRL